MIILAFYAHPDDETMLMGGTLALLSKLGARVSHLCATRGEGGECGEPAMCRREELGQVRTSELECAVRALGGTELRILNYIDPAVGEDDELYPFTDDFNRLVRQVAATIHQVKPAAVITHGSNGEYGHPAHLLCHQAAVAAVRTMNSTTAPLLYSIEALFEGHPKPHRVNRSDPAHMVLDITPVIDAKIKAALCHQTQNALFVRRPSIAAGRPLNVPEVIVHLESLHRVDPPVTTVLDDQLAALLQKSGCVIEARQ